MWGKLKEVDAKEPKDGSGKVVRLWLSRTRNKKVELRAAQKTSFFGPDQPPIDKWEGAFEAFVDTARKNG